MKRSDRKVLKALEGAYARTGKDFDLDQKVTERLMQLGYLNREAFSDVRSLEDYEINWEYLYDGYPLTRAGYEELHKNWYLRLSQNPFYRFAFDFFALAAVVVSIVVAM